MIAQFHNRKKGSIEMPEYTLKASVDVAVTADTPSEARKAAFDLMTSCRQEKRRGRPTGSPVASVTGVTIGCDGKHEPAKRMRPTTDVPWTDDDAVDQSSADAMEGSES